MPLEKWVGPRVTVESGHSTNLIPGQAENRSEGMGHGGCLEASLDVSFSGEEAC